VFEANDTKGEPHVWIAPLDRNSPPRQISSSIARRPDFTSGGRVYFEAGERDDLFLHYEDPDGGPQRKTSSERLPKTMTLIGVSPRGGWWLSASPVVAHPAGGGTPIRICESCSAGWGPGGKYFYLRFRDIGEQGGGKTIVIGLREGKELPELPGGGLKSAKDTKGLNVVEEIDMSGKSVYAAGPNPSTYAYTRITVQRNLYKIPLQ
jgi:hypothetical protein